MSSQTSQPPLAVPSVKELPPAYLANLASRLANPPDTLAQDALAAAVDKSPALGLKVHANSSIVKAKVYVLVRPHLI